MCTRQQNLQLSSFSHNNNANSNFQKGSDCHRQISEVKTIMMHGEGNSQSMVCELMYAGLQPCYVFKVIPKATSFIGNSNRFNK